MANGPPRRTSIQTSAEPVETVVSFSQPLLDSSSSEEWEGQSTPDTKSVLSESQSLGTNSQRVESFQKQDKTSSEDPKSTRLNRHRLLFENDYARMHESPAGSWNGSTNHDATPRLKPADISRTLLPPNTQIDDILPFRQDSAYESVKGAEDEESSLDVEVQAKNIRARERVEILRGRVSRTRRTINEWRQEVQSLRERLRAATDKLMRAVNTVMALDNVQNLHTLKPHYEELSQAQNELGPAEDTYDELEIRLNREETELDEEEHHFYTHNKIDLVQLPDSKLDEDISPLVKPYEPEDTEFQNLDLDNDLVKQYLAKKAEAEQIKEQLDDLENEQYRLTEELSFRTRYNLKLTKEKSAFLFDFPKTHKKLLETLETLESELYVLRGQCTDAHLFSENEYVYEPHDALIEEINESMNDAKDRSPWQTAGQHKPIEFEDKREYVNTWLLEWVQDSAFETMQLKTFIYFEYPKDVKQLEGEEWSDLALQYWSLDKAGEFTNVKHVLSTMDALLGGTGSSFGREGSLDVDLGDGGGPEEIILGSETGSYGTQKGGNGIKIELAPPKKTQTYKKLVHRTRVESISNPSID